MIPDEFTRIVTLDGRYGYTSVAAAVKSLPRVGSGGQARYSGSVFVGPGEFVETDVPIPVNGELHIQGSGTATEMAVGGGGTKITLGADAHLFAPESGFTDWAHHITFSDLVLSGGSRTGDFDLLRLYRPGFNVSLTNVFFRESPRAGLRVLDNCSDLYLYNCSAGNCKGPAIHLNLVKQSNLCNMGIWGFQVDNCGNNTDGAFLFDNQSDGGANNIVMSGIEAEGFTADKHDKLIVYRQNGGNNPIHLTISGVSAFRTPGNATAVVYDDDGPGMSMRAVLTNIHGDGYSKAVDGPYFTSQNNHVYHAVRGHTGWTEA